MTRFSAVNLDSNSGGPEYAKVVKALQEAEDARTAFLKACLVKLGMTVSQEQTTVPSLSRLHLSSVNHIEVSELLEDWKDITTEEGGEEYIKGENDTFHLEKPESRWSVNSIVKSLPLVGGSGDEKTSKDNEGDVIEPGHRIIDYNKITKSLVSHESEWPTSKETPSFNHHAYYANLNAYQNEKNTESEVFGKTLLYGEVLTSTNTILEK